MFQNQIKFRSNIFLQKSNKLAYNRSISDINSHIINNTLEAKTSPQFSFYTPNKTSPTLEFYEQQTLPVIISKRAPGSLKSILKIPGDAKKDKKLSIRKPVKRVQFTSQLKNEEPLPDLQQVLNKKFSEIDNSKSVEVRSSSTSPIKL